MKSKNIVKDNAEIREKLKRLKTVRLSPWRIEILNSFEAFVNGRGFLTKRQYKILCEIYEKPN